LGRLGERRKKGLKATRESKLPVLRNTNSGWCARETVDHRKMGKDECRGKDNAPKGIAIKLISSPETYRARQLAEGDENRESKGG